MIPLKQRRITLVGGAGFIGHHLALSLARHGAEVSIIDGLQVNNLLAFAAADHDPRNQSLNLAVINERLDLLRQGGVPLFILDARDERALSARLDGVQQGSGTGAGGLRARPGQARGLRADARVLCPDALPPGTPG